MMAFIRTEINSLKLFPLPVPTCISGIKVIFIWEIWIKIGVRTCATIQQVLLSGVLFSVFRQAAAAASAGRDDGGQQAAMLLVGVNEWNLIFKMGIKNGARFGYENARNCDAQDDVLCWKRNMKCTLHNVFKCGTNFSLSPVLVLNPFVCQVTKPKLYLVGLLRSKFP